MFVYKLIRGDEKVGNGIWMAIFAIWVMVYVFFPEVLEFFAGSEVGQTARAVWDFIGVVSMVMFIVMMFKGKGPASTEPGFWGGLAGGDGGREPGERDRGRRGREREGAEEEREEREATEQESKIERALMDLEKRDTFLLDKIIEDLGLIRKIINKHGGKEVTREKIATVLDSIKHSDVEVRANRDKIRNLFRELRGLLDMEMDLSTDLQDKIRTTFGMAAGSNVIDAGTRKLVAGVKTNIVSEINALETGINPELRKFDQQENAFQKNFSKIIRSLKLGGKRESIMYVDAAIKNKETQRDECMAVMKVIDVISKLNDNEHEALVKLIEDQKAGRFY